MSDEHHSGLLYGLEQRIPPLPAFFSALQHVLAGLVGIITPPLIIGATLGLGDYYRQRDCADRHQPDQGQRH